jgi:hypothetical protein
MDAPFTFVLLFGGFGLGVAASVACVCVFVVARKKFIAQFTFKYLRGDFNDL